MARRTLDDARPQVDALLQRLEAWRDAGRPGGRIPTEIWDDAAELARCHGVHPVARALRLNYDYLKARVQELATSSKTPSFVEVDVRDSSPRDCVLELEDARGTKLTLRLSDSRALDIAALTSAFLGRKR